MSKGTQVRDLNHVKCEWRRTVLQPLAALKEAAPALAQIVIAITAVGGLTS